MALPIRFGMDRKFELALSVVVAGLLGFAVSYTNYDNYNYCSH